MLRLDDLPAAGEMDAVVAARIADRRERHRSACGISDT